MLQCLTTRAFTQAHPPANPRRDSLRLQNYNIFLEVQNKFAKKQLLLAKKVKTVIKMPFHVEKAFLRANGYWL